MEPDLEATNLLYLAAEIVEAAINRGEGHTAA
jgi:hypothetical protein